MKRRLVYGLLVAVLGVNLFFSAQVYLQSVAAAELDDARSDIRMLVYVMEKVRKEYVEGDQVTYRELLYGALKGMLGTLDPHSEFMEPTQYRDLQDDTQGAFGGIGVVIQLRDGFVTVVAPMEDTPGYKAGILSGDRIVKINGLSTDKFTVQDAVKHLRGEPGSEVDLTVFRPASQEFKEITVERAKIEVATIKDSEGRDLKSEAAFTLGPDQIGYVRITQFGEKTADNLDEALTRLDGQGMKALILDLRGNPGGLLDQAGRVCEKFLPRGQLIVSTEGRGGTLKSEYRSRGRDQYPDLKIAVLVNLGSASASEIVAGCLQDLNRAVIVGERTFGKGSVQSIFGLQDGAALRMTTALYYTPSHKVIHERGIDPDILVPMTAEEERALYLSRLPGGLASLDEASRALVMELRDVQLDRARDMLKGVLRFSSLGKGDKELARN